jgi:hypothetical protein
LGAPPGQSTAKPLHIFIEESGVFGGDKPFCIGAILAMHPARHLSVIRALRLDNDYRTRLLYRSTDKFRRNFATSVVNYFFRASDLRFVGRVLNKDGIDQSSARSVLETLYLDQYRKLISESAPKGYPVSLTLVNHSRGGVDTILRAYLQDEMPNLIKVEVARLRENDLLQLANLFAGCAAGGHRLTNEVRLAPVKQLERSLGVPTLLAATLSRHSKFRVRVV